MQRVVCLASPWWERRVWRAAGLRTRATWGRCLSHSACACTSGYWRWPRRFPELQAPASASTRRRQAPAHPVETKCRPRRSRSCSSCHIRSNFLASLTRSLCTWGSLQWNSCRLIVFGVLWTVQVHTTRPHRLSLPWLSKSQTKNVCWFAVVNWQNRGELTNLSEVSSYTVRNWSWISRIVRSVRISAEHRSWTPTWETANNHISVMVNFHGSW